MYVKLHMRDGAVHLHRGLLGDPRRVARRAALRARPSLGDRQHRCGRRAAAGRARRLHRRPEGSHRDTPRAAVIARGCRSGSGRTCSRWSSWPQRCVGGCNSLWLLFVVAAVSPSFVVANRRSSMHTGVCHIAAGAAASAGNVPGCARFSRFSRSSSALASCVGLGTFAAAQTVPAAQTFPLIDTKGLMATGVTMDTAEFLGRKACGW